MRRRARAILSLLGAWAALPASRALTRRGSAA